MIHRLFFNNCSACFVKERLRFLYIAPKEFWGFRKENRKRIRQSFTISYKHLDIKMALAPFFSGLQGTRKRREGR